MHANAALLHKLFNALGERDAATMMSCYDGEARFRDIAFDLHSRERIATMWRMICSGDIKVLDFEVLDADDVSGRARVIDDYTIGRETDPPEKRKRVVNAIESSFEFNHGLITRHYDSCDAKAWATQAVGGPLGFLFGRFRFLRSFMARRKLSKFANKAGRR